MSGPGAAWLRSVLRGIKAFGGGSRWHTAGEIGSRVGLSEADARNLLLTLCGAGLVRLEGSQFALAPAALDFAAAFLSSMCELPVVSQALLRLSVQTGQGTAATLLDGDDIIIVASSPSPDTSITAELTLGRRRPAHATASGQVLLAQLSLEELDGYLLRAERYVLTEETITGKTELIERLAEVRKDGFAVVSRELNDHLRTIAVPIPKSVLGYGLAVGIIGPAAELRVEDIQKELLPTLHRTVRDISAATAEMARKEPRRDPLLWT